MDNDKKLDFVINLLPLILLAAKGVTAAAETFDRMYKALQDGSLTKDEMNLALMEMNATLDRVIDKTNA